MWDPRALARCVIASLVASGIAGPAPAHAQQCVDYAAHMHVMGWTDMPGDPSAIVVDGQYAYVSVYDYRWDTGLLLVYDVADVKQPRLVTSLLLWDLANDLALSGRYLYVACGSSLKVIDVADASSPRLVTDVLTEGGGMGVVVAGVFAYVAAGQRGLKILTIADPEQPQLVATVSTPGSVDDVSVTNGVAVFVEGAVNLRLLAVRNPEHPSLLGAVRLSGYGVGVVAKGGYAYAVSQLSSLQVIDISDPAQPTVLQTVETSSVPKDVTLDGAQLYVATDLAGFDVFDVGIPGIATRIGSFYTAGSRRAVCVRGGYAYCADAGQLWIADVSRPTSPSVVGAIATQTGAREVVVQGDVAFVADGYSGLKIYDVADASKPALLGAVDMPGQVNGVDVAADHAYLAAITSLQIVDVQRPWAPSVTSVVELPLGIGDVAVSGGHAFVAGGMGGLQVVDVGDPSAPELVGSLPLRGIAGRIVVVGHLGYVIDTIDFGGLVVVELADPRHPTVLARSEEFPGVAYDLAVSGSKAYVAVYGRGLVIVDVTEPRRPVLIGEAKTPSFATGVGVGGEYAYVLDGRGLQVIDVADPARPFLLGSMSPRFNINNHPPVDVTLANGVVYLATAYGGLQIAPTQCARHVPVLLSAFDARVVGGVVVVSWEASGAPAASAFGLTASVPGKQWQLAVQQVAPGRYRAHDRPALSGARERRVTYTLEVLGGDGRWTVLGERAVAWGAAPRTAIAEVAPSVLDAQTAIAFDVAEAGSIELAVYDQRGQQITILVREPLPAGRHEAVWRGTDRRGRQAASGTYYVRLTAGAVVDTRKVVLVR